MASYRHVQITTLVTMLTLMLAGHGLAFERTILRTNGSGQTASRQIVTQRTGSGYTKSTTAAGVQGNTATRSARGTWDPATKTWSRSASTTGSAGRTAASSSTVTTNGYVKSSTVTGPRGNTASRTTQGNWDPDTKTWTRTTTAGAQ